MHHELFQGIDDHQKKLKQFIEQFNLQLNNFRETEKLNNIGQTIIEALNDIIKKRNDLNYKGVARGMIESRKKLEVFDSLDKTPDQERRLNEANEKALKFFKALMNAIADTNAELMVFAYELRLNDTPEDTYTTYFLDLVEETKMIPLLKEIIFDNRKNAEGTDLTCSGQNNYRLKCGLDFSYVMKY